MFIRYSCAEIRGFFCVELLYFWLYMKQYIEKWKMMLIFSNFLFRGLSFKTCLYYSELQLRYTVYTVYNLYTIIRFPIKILHQKVHSKSKKPTLKTSQNHQTVTNSNETYFYAENPMHMSATYAFQGNQVKI